MDVRVLKRFGCFAPDLWRVCGFLSLRWRKLHEVIRTRMFLDSANSVSGGIGYTGPFRSKIRSTAAVAGSLRGRSCCWFRKRRYPGTQFFALGAKIALTRLGIGNSLDAKAA